MTTPTTHAAALRPPRDLTIPDAGSSTAREVLSLAMRRVLAEFRRIPAAITPPPDEAADHAAFTALVEHLFASSPGLVASLLRRPTLGTLVRCLRKTIGSDREAALRHLRTLRAQLAFELACLGALPGPVELRRLPDEVLSLPANLGLRFDAGMRAVRFGNGRVTFVRDGGDEDWALEAWSVCEGRPAGVSRPYRTITPSLRLALADNNPLRMFEAHPDKGGNPIDLGGRDPEEWCAVLAQCLELIGTHLPEVRREIDLFVHTFVPVGYDAEKHLSASYQEAIGTIYLTLHPNLMTMTEAVVHEFSHNKLNAFFELDAVLENAFWPLYASPVRPDPRPLHGVLLAVHAFQPIARLYERITEAGDPRAKSVDFQRRFAKIRSLNHAGAAVVLGNGRPTAAGRALLDEMRRWDEHYGVQELPDELLEH